VVAGAEVSAIQTDTGVKRTVMTDATGSYVLTNLAVGPYRLEASAPGFRTYVETGILLQVADSPVINPTLSVGQVSEQVQVEAAAAQVETRDAGVSQVMDSTRVVELPLNGRQVTDLVVLSGAATVSATTSFVRNYPSVNISVAGGLHNGLTYLLDGASHNDPINGLNLPLPFPDALLEFKLETSSLGAQFGQHSAGAVNAVTKSGTNDLHGDLFEFFRNGDLNARNFFAVVPDAIMDSGKLPIATNPCGEVQFGIKPTINESFTVEKVDYQINQKHSIFGRYELAHLVDPSGYVPGNLLTTGSATSGAYTTYPVVNNWQTQTFTLGDTYLFSPDLISSFHASVLRPTNSRGQPPPEITPAQVGITLYFEPTNNAILGLSVSGGFSIGGQGGNVPGTTNATGFQESEDLSWVKGAHQLAFGINNIHARLNVAGWTSSDGVFAFAATNTVTGKPIPTSGGTSRLVWGWRTIRRAQARCQFELPTVCSAIIRISTNPSTSRLHRPTTALS
jgi:hypothetical protein